MKISECEVWKDVKRHEPQRHRQHFVIWVYEWKTEERISQVQCLTSFERFLPQPMRYIGRIRESAYVSREEIPTPPDSPPCSFLTPISPPAICNISQQTDIIRGDPRMKQWITRNIIFTFNPVNNLQPVYLKKVTIFIHS